MDYFNRSGDVTSPQNITTIVAEAFADTVKL